MNPHKGEVAFEANGQRYVMQFSIDAICSLEAETGKGIVALLSELQDPEKLSITRTRQLFWAGLMKHHGLTVEDAGELIPAAGGLVNVIRKIEQAFQAAFPPPDDKPRPRKAGSPKNGTGPHSIRHGAGSEQTTNPSGERHLDKSA